MKILITGTNKGIGLALAQQFLIERNEVYGISRKKTPIDNRNFHFINLDLTNAEEIQSRLLELPKEIDIVIHNAATIIVKEFTDISHEEWLNLYQVNLFSIVSINQYLIKQKKTTPNAHFVHISSMGGVQGSMKFSGLSAYSTSKMAVQGLVEMLAEEYKETSLRFNTISLGAVQTEMLSQAFPDYVAPHTPEEISKFIVYFASKGGAFFNGKNIPLSVSTP